MDYFVIFYGRLGEIVRFPAHRLAVASSFEWCRSYSCALETMIGMFGIILA